MRQTTSWRRLVGLLLVVSLGFSSVEVVWAEGSVDPAPNSSATGLASASLVQADAPADTGTETDCACLCACPCANVQKVTPAFVLLHSLPLRVDPHRDPLLSQRPPRAALPEPHVRPPIA